MKIRFWPNIMATADTDTTTDTTDTADTADTDTTDVTIDSVITAAIHGIITREE